MSMMTDTRLSDSSSVCQIANDIYLAAFGDGEYAGVLVDGEEFPRWVRMAWVDMVLERWSLEGRVSR